MRARLRRALERPVDGASVAVFRCAFGALLFVGTARLLAKGYVREAFLAPRTFFPLWPLEAVLRPLPGAGMYFVYGAIAAASLGLALGLHARLCAALVCVLFTYAHFVDLTNYLNHYWLVTLLTGILATVPGTGGPPSRGARGAPGTICPVPAWGLYLLRFQVGVVYVFAGLAKLEPDWLFAAQPMRIWLAANTDVPLVGPLFREVWFAYAMSWAGALYDLTICGWLLWRRSRPFAYATVVFFHLLTARLFNIGMFPYFMIAASILFLDPAWLRARFRLPARLPERGREGRARAPLAGLAIYAVVQLGLPLRARLYDGNPLWHEQGYRFGWNVMLIEKMGSAEFSTVERASGLRRAVRVRDHLTAAQEKAMATQPDLIVAFARQLRAAEARAGRDVAVYADVFVVLNGRPAARLVDATVDLGAESDGLAPKRWILPAPP